MKFTRVQVYILIISTLFLVIGSLRIFSDQDFIDGGLKLSIGIIFLAMFWGLFKGFLRYEKAKSVSKILINVGSLFLILGGAEVRNISLAVVGISMLISGFFIIVNKENGGD